MLRFLFLGPARLWRLPFSPRKAHKLLGKSKSRTGRFPYLGWHLRTGGWIHRAQSRTASFVDEDTPIHRHESSTVVIRFLHFQPLPDHKVQV